MDSQNFLFAYQQGRAELPGPPGSLLPCSPSDLSQMIAMGYPLHCKISANLCISPRRCFCGLASLDILNCANLAPTLLDLRRGSPGDPRLCPSSKPVNISAILQSLIVLAHYAAQLIMLIPPDLVPSTSIFPASDQPNPGMMDHWSPPKDILCLRRLERFFLRIDAVSTSIPSAT